MTVTFGDAEPLDAYDAGDPVDVCLNNLRRTLELAGRDPLDYAVRVAVVAQLLGRLSHRIRASG